MLVADTALIHPKAHVEDSDIGEWVRIWQFASVLRGAIIGRKSVIGACATIDGAFVGEECRVGSNASIFAGHYLGDRVFVGPGVVLCNDHWPRAHKAGYEGFVCAAAYGEDYQRRRAATIVVGDGASIGANATILPGVIIGENAMVAAGAVCGCSVPAGHVFVSKGDIRPISKAMEAQRLDTRIRNAQYREPAMEAEW